MSKTEEMKNKRKIIYTLKIGMLIVLIFFLMHLSYDIGYQIGKEKSRINYLEDIEMLTDTYQDKFYYLNEENSCAKSCLNTLENMKIFDSQGNIYENVCVKSDYMRCFE